MYIRRFGVKYAVIDKAGNEICRFDLLSDACIVERFLSNKDLPKDEAEKALKLIREDEGRNHHADRAKKTVSERVPEEVES